MDNRSKYPGLGSTDNVVLDATGDKKLNNCFDRNSNIRRSDQQKLVESKLPQVYGEVIQTPSTPGGDEGLALIRERQIIDLEEYDPPPRDHYHIVYIIMLINGIGVLMPWNMFINAKSYFIEYKFRDVQDEEYVVNFLTYVGVCAQVPNLLLCFINTFIQPRGSLTARILASLVILIITLTFTVGLAMLDSFSWPQLFFIITLITVVVSNGAVGIYQNCVYGMAADLPMKYTACVVLGSNVCGTFVSILNILTGFAGGGNPRMAAIYYFLAALFIVLVCFDSYFVLPYCRFYLYYKNQADNRRTVEHDAHMDKHKGKQNIGTYFSPYLTVFNEAWVQMFNIFFVFFVTLAIFPAMQSDIVVCDENYFLAGDYFVSIGCFLFFNFFAVVGNLVPHWIQFPGPKYVWIPILLRGLLIPYFFFCNYRPKLRTFPVFINNDYAYMFMGIFMAFTAGYFSSLVMMYAPKVVDPHKARMAAMLATFFLVLGIVSGVNFNFFIVFVNENLGPLTPLGSYNSSTSLQLLNLTTMSTVS